jgi:hypothetical protein
MAVTILQAAAVARLNASTSAQIPFQYLKSMEYFKQPAHPQMKRIKRIGTIHNGVISFIWMERPRRKVQSIWHHTDHDSYHLVRLYFGKLVILRIRQTKDHADRLGLPAI